jgi:hypothetical protein
MTVNHKKFTDQSAGRQWSAIIGIIAVVFGGFGAAVWSAGDTIIDLKYATDEDVRAVQETVVQQFDAIQRTVQANTATVKATSSSVDGLTLVVLDLRIRDLEDDLIDLESEKINAGDNWTARNERTMRDRDKALADLKVQRDRLFTRILDSP